MMQYGLRPIPSLLGPNPAGHIAMTHALRYKELQRNIRNQFIPKKGGYLNNTYIHNDHSEGRLSCLIYLRFSGRLRWEILKVLTHAFMILIKPLRQRILRKDPCRRLSGNSIISSYLHSRKFQVIASHYIDQALIVKYT